MSRSIVRVGSILLVIFVLCHGTAVQDRASRVKRIVGGHRPRNKDSYGYIASLQVVDGKKFKHLCGGTHVGNGWILTAAHCLLGRKLNTLLIRLGADNLSTTTNESLYPVLEAKRNNYMATFMTNDIALLRIDLKGRAVPTVELAKSTLQEKTNCEIGGFGSPRYNAPASDYFQVAPIKVVDMFKCIMGLGVIVIPALTGSALCAGGGQTDTCQGDSGSALLCNGIQCGITSYGRDCGVEGVPAIYTNVAKYSSWIASVIEKPTPAAQ